MVIQRFTVLLSRAILQLIEAGEMELMLLRNKEGQTVLHLAAGKGD